MRWVPCVTRSAGPGGTLEVAVGHPLVDEYLEFLTARARPNTRLAVAFDLKVFFTVVDKTPVRVTSADVMAFIRSQRSGGEKVVRIDGSAGVSSRGGRSRLERDDRPPYVKAVSGRRRSRTSANGELLASQGKSRPLSHPNGTMEG